MVKAEVTRNKDREPRDNPHFIVTNLRLVPRNIYALYCEREDCENRVKEMKIDLESGSTSCNAFDANQMRLTTTAMAFVLMQELRADAKGTQWQRATVPSIRWRLLKISARFVESTRRIVMHMPKSFGLKHLFAQLAVSP